MHGQQVFQREFDALRHEHGERIAEQTFFVLATVVYWLRCLGYGQITLSAINHSFGPKVESRQIIPVLECPGG